jgi:hypothetical protein
MRRITRLKKLAWNHQVDIKLFPAQLLRKVIRGAFTIAYFIIPNPRTPELHHRTSKGCLLVRSIWLKLNPIWNGGIIFEVKATNNTLNRGN